MRHLELTISPSPTPTAPSNGNIPLPSEIVIHIFCHLPLLSDVFALAATCPRLHDIWSANVTPIYNKVAPRSIACQEHARRFLTDQGGPTYGAPMSIENVVRMARNASVVEKAILQFEREIVSRVRTDSYSAQELQACYGAGACGHSPTLTRTERPRFISSYYTLWGLMELDASEWESRLEHRTSKQLYCLYEMSKLTQRIGREEAVHPPLFPDEPPDSVHSINTRRSEKRIALEDRVWQQIQDISQRIFNQDALYQHVYARHEGFMWFVVMWDHWQPSLKDMVLHQSTSRIKPSPDVVKRYLWDDDPKKW